MSQACTLTLLPWRDEIFLHRGTPLGNLPHRRSVITPDASLTGWEGIWEGRSEHMNVLKLRAVHLALKALLPFVFHKYVLIRMDSNFAVNHINHQGGVKSLRCLQVATDLLPWAWHGNTCPHNPHSRCSKQCGRYSVQDGASPRRVVDRLIVHFSPLSSEPSFPSEGHRRSLHNSATVVPPYWPGKL